MNNSFFNNFYLLTKLTTTLILFFTVLFLGYLLVKSYKVNDEESYMSQFDLSEEQKQLIRDRNWIGCVQGGSNIYFLYKITTVFGDSLYKLGAKQAGMTYEEFLATRNVSGAT